MINTKNYDVSITHTKFADEDYEDINISKDDDESIATKIDVRLSEARTQHKKVCENAEDSLKLFRGQVDKIAKTSGIKYKSKSVLSRIFLTIRNLVGLSTDSPAYVEMIPDEDNPKSIRRTKAVEANVEWKLIDTNFYENLTMALFEAWIKRDAFFKWFWNDEEDDIDAELITIEELTISPEATDIQNAEYVIYHPEKNRNWWKKNYPDQYDKIKFYKQKRSEYISTINTKRGNVARLIEYWEDDFVIRKVQSKEKGVDIILDKKRNPYYEYRTAEEQMRDKANELNPTAIAELKLAGITEPTTEELVQVVPELANFVPITNYLTASRKPFVQLPSIKLAGNMYSEEITQQAREVFLSMIDKKRAYADNLAGCNQKIVVDRNTFNKEQAEKITTEPNQVILADFQNSSQPVYIAKGGEVPSSFHADISHDEAYIDDLFGNHEISRGAGAANTLGQDQMNYESDRTPIRFQTRGTERAIVEIVEGWLQLMSMYYNKTHYARKFGEKEGLELLEIINEDIKEGIKPHIRPGSMVTLPRQARQQRAKELWSAGAIDPFTFYQELGMPNPGELSDRLVNWLRAGVISAEDPEKIQADQYATDPEMQTIERADQENTAFQQGDNVPPTPPEFISPEHVKAHYAFLGDKKKKMEDKDRDLLMAHAETDKAALGQLMAEQQQGTQQAGQNLQEQK